MFRRIAHWWKSHEYAHKFNLKADRIAELAVGVALGMTIFHILERLI